VYLVSLELCTVSKWGLLHGEIALSVKPLKELAKVRKKFHGLMSLTKAIGIFITDSNEVFHSILVVVNRRTNPNAYGMILMSHLVDREGSLRVKDADSCGEKLCCLKNHLDYTLVVESFYAWSDFW
jgi:hypothetical protein